jgi:hypothetical protein
MEDGAISNHHRKCYTSFSQLLLAIQQPAHPFREQITLSQASNEFDRYKVWAGNVGAAHGGRNYHISLDYRLREASFYKDRVSSTIVLRQLF